MLLWGRVVTNKYDRWLDKGLGRLDQDFCKGSFRPQNESDLKCHLYHTLLETKPQLSMLTDNHLVVSEYKFPHSDAKVDLAIVKRVKDNLELRLLIEIKETLRPDLSLETVKNRICRDISKLKRHKSLRISGRKPRIVFFFTGAQKEGIGAETNHLMKKLEKSLHGVRLWWGPKSTRI